MPALPLGDAGQYVAAAYLVFLVLVVVYVAIVGIRVARLESELDTLGQLMDKRSEPADDAVAQVTG